MRSRCAAGRDGLALEGFAGLPTYSKANALGLYLFVNGRPVRDKLLFGAVRAAYADYLPRDRHPVVALFVDVDPREVDVNVHPAKAEVRFRDAGLVRAMIVRALHEALARGAHRAASTGGAATVAAFRPAGAARAQRLGLAPLAGAPVSATRPRRGRRDRPGFSAPAQAAFALDAVTAKPPRRLSGLPWTDRRPPEAWPRRARGWQRCAARARGRCPPRTRGEPADLISSTARSAPPAPSSTKPISWRRPATASSSSTSTPLMSASSMSA